MEQDPDWNTVKFFRNATADDVRARLGAGANPHARDERGRTPLHTAAADSTPEVVAALLDVGAKLEARDVTGRTPLHMAVHFGAGATVAALLRAGARLEARDGDGWTPLHRAAANGTPEAVSALLDAGADPHNRTATGGTALDLASGNRSMTGTQALQRLGAAQLKAHPVARVLAAYERGERDFRNIEVLKRTGGRDFAGQGLAGADFSGSVLKDLDFRGANLAGASFRGATISYSDFSRACLAEADLSDATARHARFLDADLSRARSVPLDAAGATPTMAAITLTVREVEHIDGDWELEVPGTLVSAPDSERAIAAAIAGELASVHPTAYDDEWTLGSPLPSATPMQVYDEDGDLLASYTAARNIPVGTRFVANMAGWRISCSEAPGDNSWPDCEEALGPDWQRIYATQAEAEDAALRAQADGESHYSDGDERFRNFAVAVVVADTAPDGYLVYTCDQDGGRQAVTAWYDAEPTASDVERHTDTFGGIVRRLSDNQWTYGAGWHDTEEEAIEAVEFPDGPEASQQPIPDSAGPSGP